MEREGWEGKAIERDRGVRGDGGRGWWMVDACEAEKGMGVYAREREREGEKERR